MSKTKRVGRAGPSILHTREQFSGLSVGGQLLENEPKAPVDPRSPSLSSGLNRIACLPKDRNVPPDHQLPARPPFIADHVEGGDEEVMEGIRHSDMASSQLDDPRFLDHVSEGDSPAPHPWRDALVEVDGANLASSHQVDPFPTQAVDVGAGGPFVVGLDEPDSRKESHRRLEQGWRYQNVDVAVRPE
jgi:hypothetical protein